MQEFYRAIHEVVGELMYAKNFFIALYDEERQLINFPYYVDELADAPDPNQWDALGTGEARGVTAYVLRTGEPELIDYERHMALIEQGEIVLLGLLTEDSSWLGVPLRAEGHTLGVLVVQTYTNLIERGERLWPEPQILTSGFTKHVLETGEPLLINEDLEAEAERYGSFVLAGEMPKSILWVPLFSRGRPKGVIALDNFDRE